MEQNYLIYLLEAVVTTIVLGTIAIPLLKKLKARQSVREDKGLNHTGLKTVHQLWEGFS